ncbi:MAG TPA: glycosyltransferase [Bacteroidota bacterium]|nr:glycosyltransferase [Bacteroidota bacterium]
MSSPTLSLAMIVKDEAKFLDGCLESVRGIVQEIVVVDTGSRDDTEAIARRHGARVFNVPWRNDFGAARNASLSHCTGDWIFVLDADERFAPGQEEQLRACLAQREAAAFSVLLRCPHTMPTGRSLQVMPYARLFRRDGRFRFEGTVHEQIAPSIERTGGRILPTTLAIEHLGYDQGVDVLRRKAERNSALLRARLARNPDDAYAAYQVGSTETMFMRYREAAPYLRRALRPGGLPASLQAVVWNLIAEGELRTGRAAEAEQSCRASIAIAPVQMAARWYLVGTHIERKDFAGAIPPMDELLALFYGPQPPPPPGVSVDIRVEASTILQIRGQCLWKMGDAAGALRSFTEALRLNPAEPTLRANYAAALRACAPAQTQG